MKFCSYKLVSLLRTVFYAKTTNTIIFNIVKMVKRQDKVQYVLWFHESNSPITVKKKFKKSIRKSPPIINSIKWWYNKFRTAGFVADL